MVPIRSCRQISTSSARTLTRITDERANDLSTAATLHRRERHRLCAAIRVLATLRNSAWRSLRPSRPRLRPPPRVPRSGFCHPAELGLAIFECDLRPPRPRQRDLLTRSAQGELPPAHAGRSWHWVHRRTHQQNPPSLRVLSIISPPKTFHSVT